ncbi:MAG TPA: peptidoglycan-binding domain-containing protein [Roseomonas sp.]
MRRRLHAAALLATLLSGAAVAAEPRIALVIASGQVAAREIAPVPACPPSARAVGRQLAASGFIVVESIDQTRGETGAAIAELARRLRGTADARVVVYACGPVAELNGRAFVLPASALLERSSDVLTQGVLLRSLLDTLAETKAGAALLAIDAFADPAAMPPLPAPQADAGIAVIVSSQTARQGQRTALAAALLEELGGQAAIGADPGTLLTRLQTRLEQAPERPLHRLERPDTTMALLPAAAPEPAPVAAPAEAAPPAEPAPGVSAAPPDSPAPSAPAAEPQAEPTPAAVPPSAPAPVTAPTPAAPPLTDEIPLSVADRRAIQGSLAALGYYADRLDGNFGTGTRAAIRRYQREIGEAATGALTAIQARRLLAGAALRPRR